MITTYTFPNASELIYSTATNKSIFVPSIIGTNKATLTTTNGEIIQRLCTNWNQFFIWLPVLILLFTTTKVFLNKRVKKPNAPNWVIKCHHWAEWGSDYFVELFALLMLYVTLTGRW